MSRIDKQDFYFTIGAREVMNQTEKPVFETKLNNIPTNERTTKDILSIFNDTLTHFKNKKDNKHFHVSEASKSLINDIDNTIVDAEAKEIQWDILTTIIDKFPAGNETIQPIQFSIANLVGRNIIRTRQWHDVEDIPVEALQHLREISWEVEGDKTEVHEGAYAYGWGHPEENVEQHMKKCLQNDRFYHVMRYLPHLMILDQEICTEFFIESIIEEHNNTISTHNLKALYESILRIGTKENGYKLQHPRQISYWSLFDELNVSFEYSDTTLNEIHTAIPTEIVDDLGELDELSKIIH